MTNRQKRRTRKTLEGKLRDRVQKNRNQNTSDKRNKVKQLLGDEQGPADLRSG